MPSTRFRHTTIPIKPSQGTPLEDEASYAIGPSKKLPDGELLFCFGGYNTIGEEFGADSIFVSPPKLPTVLPTLMSWASVQDLCC